MRCRSRKAKTAARRRWKWWSALTEEEKAQYFYHAIEDFALKIMPTVVNNVYQDNPFVNYLRRGT